MNIVGPLATVLFAPGALGLLLAGYRRSWPIWWSAALSISLASWPLGLLWSSKLGWTWSASALRSVAGGLWIAISALVLIRAVSPHVGRAAARPNLDGSDSGRRARALRGAGRQWPFLAGAASLVALSAYLRIDDAAGLVAPPWVDGLHHTVIAQLIRDTGQLPTSYRPYLEVDGFFYHFGFHATAAAAGALGQVESRLSVLWLGQALAVLTVLAQLAVGLRFTGRRLPALVGAAVPAALYWFPAYFVSWGRFTQLAGLVMLPGILFLVLDAVTARSRWRHPWMGTVLTMAAIAGLVLTHYRVTVFLAVTLAVVVGGQLWRCRTKTRLLVRYLLLAIGALLLTAPWFAGALLPGVQRLGQTSAQWYLGPTPEAVDDLPEWLFTTYQNRPLLILAAAGLALAAARRRRPALALAVVLAVLVVAAEPAWLGLPPAWFLPPFALAISAYLPVGASLSFLTAEVRTGRWRTRWLEPLTVGALLATSGWIGWQRPTVVNPVTVLLKPADLDAAAWIRQHTAPESRFVVSTAGWNLGAYRGLDGGYWLPLTASRATNIPPALYFYGSAGYAKHIAELGQLLAKGDPLSDRELRRAMHLAGARYVYVGPASEADGSKLSAGRLDKVGFLTRVYAKTGVGIWECDDCP